MTQFNYSLVDEDFITHASVKFSKVFNETHFSPKEDPQTSASEQFEVFIKLGLP